MVLVEYFDVHLVSQKVDFSYIKFI